jgi:hypothetical protein
MSEPAETRSAFQVARWIRIVYDLVNAASALALQTEAQSTIWLRRCEPAVFVLEIPPLRLVEKEGLLFTLDNRRLEAFRRAGVEMPWRLATADELASEKWKFTTTNRGISVRIRGQPQ